MTKIKLFATDVDGTLTDGCMYYAENGLELKKFNFQDGMGFKLLKDLGIKTAIITSENTTIVQKRADKLRIDYLSMGTWAKLDFIKKICQELDITLDDVAYVGDDINDIELLKDCPYFIIDICILFIRFDKNIARKHNLPDYVINTFSAEYFFFPWSECIHSLRIQMAINMPDHFIFQPCSYKGNIPVTHLSLFLS